MWDEAGYSEEATSERTGVLSISYDMIPSEILHEDLLYRRMMPMAEDKTVSMEKTPSYFTSPPYDIPEMMKKGVPNAKLILLLCDPVKRVLSNFIHEVSLLIFMNRLKML